MKRALGRSETSEQEIALISEGGERVTHLLPNGCYLAHLSIYRFALQFVQGAVVLDMGSGSGYGAAYLAANGASSVEGIDVSEEAVAFSRRYFQSENLHYQAMDLQSALEFGDGVFDVVFSSNTLEHVADVVGALREAWRLLKPEGCLVLAVPPVTDEKSRAMNAANPYHLHIWTPGEWDYVLRLLFSEVLPYSHVFAKPEPVPDFFAPPKETQYSEQDFAFIPLGSVEEMHVVPSMTAVFVARARRPVNEIPSVDDSVSRSLLIGLQERYAELIEDNKRLRAQLDAINRGHVMRAMNRVTRCMQRVRNGLLRRAHR